MYGDSKLMKTKTISIRIDDAAETAIETIIANITRKYGTFGVTKSHVVCAAIKEFAKVDSDIQKERIVSEKMLDGRKASYFRYLY